ncbi:MAG TPA: ornithine cyclodeaminase family protein [Candidatus Thermoplasmatota archaeon]|nr:ornithine cyclodeaminase family protein [Candidatus Thermoplasmatota archaeon]
MPGPTHTTTRLLSAADVIRCLNMDEAIAAVEDAFLSYQKGEAQMPPKSYIDIPEFNGDFRSMPARVGGAASVKWVNVHADNPGKHGMPTVLATLILGDPATGFPLAVMDATLLTAYRTAAAAAVATKYLAREDAKTLGVIGAGGQSAYQIAAITRVRNFTEVVISDARPEAAKALAERVARHNPKFKVRVGTVQEAAGCDVLTTVTPVHKPIVQREWVKPGTHINAIGADAPGKEELDPAILWGATIILDDWEQATHSGEVNVPLHDGMLKREQIRGTIGALIAGAIKGRGSREEITIFDSTGLAIQDAAVARLVYAQAVKQNLGTEFRFAPVGDMKVPDVLDELRA